MNCVLFSFVYKINLLLFRHLNKLLFNFRCSNIEFGTESNGLVSNFDKMREHSDNVSESIGSVKDVYLMWITKAKTKTETMEMNSDRLQFLLFAPFSFGHLNKVRKVNIGFIMFTDEPFLFERPRNRTLTTQWESTRNRRSATIYSEWNGRRARKIETYFNLPSVQLSDIRSAGMIKSILLSLRWNVRYFFGRFFVLLTLRFPLVFRKVIFWSALFPFHISPLLLLPLFIFLF